MQQWVLRLGLLGLLAPICAGRSDAQLPPASAGQCVTTAIAGGTADAITIPRLPCTTTTTLLILTLKATNATTTPTIQAPDTQPLVVLRYTGSAVVAGDLPAGARVQLTSNGQNWFLLTIPLGAAGPPGPPGAPGPSGTSSAIAVNQAALVATPIPPANPSMFTAGAVTAGDGGAASYVYSATNCPLNSGAGDGGSQIAPASGGGCWNIVWTTSVSPKVWKCVGNGTADDTACVNATIAAAAGHATVSMIGGLYRVRALNTLPDGTRISGTQVAGGIYTGGCSTGLLGFAVNTNILTTGGTVTLRDLCVQEPTGTTSGVAVNLSGSGVAGSVLDNLLVVSACDGIDISGGSPMQYVVLSNSYVSHNVGTTGCAGVRIGHNSVHGSTNVHMSNNYVDCFAGSATNVADGLVIEDSGGSMFTNNEEFACRWGQRVVPGTNQYVQYNSYIGHLAGDTNTVGTLLVQPQTASSIVAADRYLGSWASNAQGTGAQVIVDGSLGFMEGLEFNGQQFYTSGGNTALSLIHATNVKVVASTICSPSGASTAPLVTIDATSAVISLIGNTIGACNHTPDGTFLTGISIATGARDLIITGNHFTDGASGYTAISWAPAGTETAVIHDNTAIDDVTPSVTVSGTTLNLPMNPVVVVGGGGTVNTINPAWRNRQLTIIPAAGSTWTLGGGFNICDFPPATPQAPLIGVFEGFGGCWHFNAPGGGGGSTGQPGYSVLPGGEQMNWGAGSIPGGGTSVTVSYAHACPSASAADSFSFGPTGMGTVYLIVTGQTSSSMTVGLASTVSGSSGVTCPTGSCGFGWMSVCH